jgi:hypothetical protein
MLHDVTPKSSEKLDFNGERGVLGWNLSPDQKFLDSMAAKKVGSINQSNVALAKIISITKFECCREEWDETHGMGE